MEQAACRGMGTYKFFAERNDVKARQEAQLTCFHCPVINECKEYRDRTGSTYGIWAGKNFKPNE